MDAEPSLAALRAGDEQAFATLVRRHGAALLRLARMHAPSHAVAEEILQETWIAVLRGLEGFEGRSSLRTWMARILVRIARERSARERRSLPFAALERSDDDDSAPSVDPSRFILDGRNAGGWSTLPLDVSALPEQALLSAETQEVIDAAVERLPIAQREVIVLRDIEGWSAAEACDALDLTPGHQRVLLHRARAKVREALEAHLTAEFA